MRAYYNENDPSCVAWLRELIKRGAIADGDVDDRSIRDVRGRDLAGYTQCHFFAGIGAWSYALRCAGWDDARPVWTGSCPCQPFSQAGQRKGTKDDRHLWPEFRRLIAECVPPVVFGEQVASKDGRAWLAAVRTEMEAMGYAVGAADLCAAGIGAPHIRQRLYFGAHRVADDHGSGRRVEPQRDGQEIARGQRGKSRTDADRCSYDDGLGNAMRAGSPAREHEVVSGKGRRGQGRAAQQSGRPLWADADWIPCSDGKLRPVEPGTFPLAHGAPARVGRLRGYGNAIVPQVAQAFIEAFQDCLGAS